MRVAIYARYSSDNQREASIEDQFRECRAFADREGWSIVERYSDSAISGASSHRPGLQALLRDTGRYDVVLAESLDRLSRDMEDTASLHKRLSFMGVRIVTLAEGDITHLHVGFKGTMNAVFLKDLADKTRRGLRGRVEAGKSGGGLCFGYRVVRTPAGLPATGEREIDPDEAAIVIRIFEEFVAGASAKSIAKQLNAERVAGPGGGPWGPSTIHGNPKRGTGVLNNELYIGRQVWNRLRYVKDPDTGKRVSRLNPASELVVTEVPDLRIVANDLWQAAKTRQQQIRRLVRNANPVRARRPSFLLSGLTKCGVCGSGFTMYSKDRLACAGARDRGICGNRITIRRDEVERRVLAAMQERLWNDELYEEFCREFTRERNRLYHEATAAVGASRRELSSIEKQLDEAFRWITTEWNGQRDARAAEVDARMTVLTDRKAELNATIAAAERAQKDRPLLHPEMGKLYRAWVLELRAGLQDDDHRAGAATALRAMVEKVELTPKDGVLGIELFGDLAAMLAAASPTAETEDLRRQVTLVAGGGFEPPTFGL